MSVQDSLHDRVWEAYYGELTVPMMRKTQKRIHWICAQATGERILDIGCSSGLTPILLAREGRYADGVDNDPRSISKAEAHAASESETTRSRLRFFHDDFFTSTRLSGQLYDTVVLSEVLEHLLKPEEMLQRAVEHLAPNGRLIVTVPYGINDFIDHKKTYYLHDLLEMMGRATDILHYEMIDSWIGVVAEGKRNADSTSYRFAQTDLQAAEAAFHVIERRLVDNLSAKNTLIGNLTQQKEELETEIKRLKAEIAGLSKRATQAEAQVARLDNSIAYRMGKLIQNAPKSPRNMVRLPMDIWTLRRELQQRRQGGKTSAQS